MVNKKIEYDFHYYALNHDFNRDKIYFYNVFNNCKVYEYTIKLCNDYWKGKYTYDEFVKKLDGIIKWEEWSRCEYEIVVSGLFTEKEHSEKIDCWQQAHENIDLIAMQVINEYKRKHPRKKQIIKG